MRRTSRSRTLGSGKSPQDDCRGRACVWIEPDVAALLKNGGNVSFARIGVNKASTFAPVEKQMFSGTAEQCFLLGYRAICREVFVRRCRVGVADVMRSMDQGRSLEAQAGIQTYASAFAHGSQLGTDDLGWHKSQYDKLLTKAISRNSSQLSCGCGTFRESCAAASCIPNTISPGISSSDSIRLAGWTC